MTAERWLVLGSHIPPAGRLGGMVRYTVEMTRALESHPAVEVHVHCRPESVDFLSDDVGIGRDRLHPSARGSIVVDSIREHHGFARLIRTVGPAVVFGSKQLVPRRAEAFQVLTVHDMIPFDRPGDFGPAKRLLLPRAYLRSILAADLLACVSGATQRRLLEVVPEVANRAVVVGNAMTSSLTSVAPERMPGLDGAPFALVVGDRSPRKNVGFVVDLWPDVLALRPDARLVLVGPPGWGTNQELPGLSALIARGSVVEAGLVSDATLRWAYENAAVTLCPSRLEGFGLPVVEALGFGCPVVHSTDAAQVEAAQGHGIAMSLDDRRGWIDAIVRRLDTGSGTRPVMASPQRSWGDAGAELVAAVRAARARPVTTAVPASGGR